MAGTYNLSHDVPMQSLSRRSNRPPQGSGHNLRPDGSENHVTISSSTKKGEEDDGSEKNMIQKTTDWDIQYSDQDQAIRRRESPDADDSTAHDVITPDVVRGHTLL